jgi:hypothetical protein
VLRLVFDFHFAGFHNVDRRIAKVHTVDPTNGGKIHFDDFLLPCNFVGLVPVLTSEQIYDVDETLNLNFPPFFWTQISFIYRIVYQVEKKQNLAPNFAKLEFPPKKRLPRARQKL